MERQKVSLGKNLAGSNAGAFTYWLSDSGQGWQCPPPRASARPSLPRPRRPPAPATGKLQTPEEGTFAVATSVAAG